MELTPCCVANPEVIHASVNCKGPAHDVVDAAWIQGHLVSKIFSFSFLLLMLWQYMLMFMFGLV
jgi:hypothetical protein